MKNILYFYYGIIVSEIDNKGYFKYQDKLFCFYRVRREIKDINILVNLNRLMIRNNILINEIIPNNYHNPLTLYDNHYYVLIYVKCHNQDNLFNFVLAPSIKEFSLLNRNNWAYLWEIKIDYIEKNYYLTDKYPLLHESIDYYIGLSENAIKYFKMLNLINEKLFISHRRINHDYYNPLEIIFDYKVRDIAEYIKMTFFKKEKTINDILVFINSILLNEMDYLLLYNRLLYPSYYFDIYDDIISGKRVEEDILLITDNSSSYEELLDKIYNFIKEKYSIIKIDWINNNVE